MKAFLEALMRIHRLPTGQHRGNLLFFPY